MSHCKIHIDDIYKSGSTIKGKVSCFFTSEKTVRSIKAILSGKEHTQWLVRETEYDHQTKKHKSKYVSHHGDNVFLSSSIILFGNRGRNETMKAGTYHYDLQFSLPNHLPSSYDGTYGWIKYMIKIVVDRPMQFDIEEDRFFRVRSPIDFNSMDKNLQLPHSVGGEKYNCCLCCTSGPISMDVTVDKLAFVLGEYMKLKIEVTNLSNSNIEDVTIKLTQTITSEVTTPRHDRKKETELLYIVTKSGVGAHGENTYNLDMEIPKHIVVPNFRQSSLFNVFYTMEIKASVDGCHDDLDVELSPVLGHIKFGPNSITPPPSRTQYSNTAAIYNHYAPHTNYGAINPSCVLPMPPPPTIGFNAPHPVGVKNNSEFVKVPVSSVIPGAAAINNDSEWVTLPDQNEENKVSDPLPFIQPTAPNIDPGESPSAPPPAYDDIYKQKK